MKNDPYPRDCNGRFIKGGIRVGTPVLLGLSTTKIYEDHRECKREYQRRKKEKQENSIEYYTTIGDWTPEDELPDPDELSESEL